jgi:hypothetical protein
MEHGPVDVVVVAVGEPHFDGSMLTELERLSRSGTIRVLDAMVVMKREDGSRATLDIEELPKEQSSALGFVDTRTRGLFDSGDADTLFEGMAPGSAVVTLAIENLWAKSLIEAMHEVGGEIAMDIRIPAATVDETYAAMAGAAR